MQTFNTCFTFEEGKASKISVQMTANLWIGQFLIWPKRYFAVSFLSLGSNSAHSLNLGKILLQLRITATFKPIFIPVLCGLAGQVELLRCICIERESFFSFPLLPPATIIVCSSSEFVKGLYRKWKLRVRPKKWHKFWQPYFPTFLCSLFSSS